MYSPRFVLPSFGPDLAAILRNGGLRRPDACAALIAGLSLLAPALAQAQKAPAQQAQPDAGKLDELKQHEDELKVLRDAQQKSAETEASIKREIEEISADRRKLNEALIATAARVRAVESTIDDNRKRTQ